jgi:small subunit ribosomal protein S1
MNEENNVNKENETISAGIPEQVNIAEKPVRVPEQQADIAEQPASTPEQQAGIPEQADIAEQPVKIPEQQPDIPEQRADTAEQPVEILEQQAGIVKQTVATPELPASIEEQTAATPELPVSIEEQTAATPELQTGIEEQTAATPELQAGIAEPSADTSEQSVSAPEQQAVPAAGDNEAAPPQAQQEVVPSMDDFKDEIARSFKKINEGDILTGTVIGISETEVILDLRYYTEGIIKLEELSNDPGFSIKADVKLGEEMSATVLQEDDGRGNILLSRKRADDILAWEQLKEAMASKKVFRVKISQAVKAGVVTYLYGVRAFIPASQLSLSYVENLDTWVGKEIDAVVITVNEESTKLVLSGKEVERDRELRDKKSKISRLQVGIVTTGTVEKITPYGAFVNIGEGLSGLLHISQICDRKIKTPSEVIKEGETVTVKILDIKEGKISLSMKAVEEKEEVLENAEEASSAYSTGEEATTGLAALLKNIKL